MGDARIPPLPPKRNSSSATCPAEKRAMSRQYRVTRSDTCRRKRPNGGGHSARGKSNLLNALQVRRVALLLCSVRHRWHAMHHGASDGSTVMTLA